MAKKAIEIFNLKTGETVKTKASKKDIELAKKLALEHNLPLIFH